MELQATQDFRLVFSKPIKVPQVPLPFPHIPPPQQVVQHQRASLHGENEGHHLIKIPFGGRAVIVKLSVFILIKERFGCNSV